MPRAASASARQCFAAVPIARIGRFIDRCERRDREWRIADRRVALEWMSEEIEDSPDVPGGYKLENFAPTRHRSDPSYERDRP